MVWNPRKLWLPLLAVQSATALKKHVVPELGAAIIKHAQMYCAAKNTPTACGAQITGDAFADFCATKESGICLGSSKTKVFTDSVAEAAEFAGNRRVVVAETGSHFGDGSLRLLAALEKRSTAQTKHRLLVLPDTPDEVAVINKLMQLAVGTEGGRLTEVSVQALGDDNRRAQALDSALSAGLPTGGFVDVLVLDGQPSTYPNILSALLQAGHLRPGARIVVDNWKRKSSEMVGLQSFVEEPPQPLVERIPGLRLDVDVHQVSKPYPDEVAVISVSTAATAAAVPSGHFAETAGHTTN
jgi:hypothetical protein